MTTTAETIIITTTGNPYDDPRFDRSAEEKAAELAAALAAHSAATGAQAAMALLYPPQE